MIDRYSEAELKRLGEVIQKAERVLKEAFPGLGYVFIPAIAADNPSSGCVFAVTTTIGKEQAKELLKHAYTVEEQDVDIRDHMPKANHTI